MTSLIITPQKVRELSYLDSNLDEHRLVVAIRHAQLVIADDVIGRCLLNQLEVLVCDGMINDPENAVYKELLECYLWPLLAYLVPEELGVPLSYPIRNTGMVRLQDDQKTSVPIGEVREVMLWYKQKARQFKARTTRYLLAHKDDITELRECRCSWVGANALGDVGVADNPRRYFSTLYR